MAKKTGFIALISLNTLATWAGPRAFARGRAYFQAGAVQRLAITHNRISARVEGTDLYHTELSLQDNELDFNCSCPVGDDGEFCKHAVAVGLAWLAESPSTRTHKVDPELDAIRTWLMASDKNSLVDLVIAQVARDEDFATRLLTTAQRHTGVSPAVAKEIIRKAFTTRDYLTYREVSAFAARAAIAIDMLAGIVASAAPTIALDLTEYTVQLGMQALGSADDSNGEIGELVAALAELHEKACAHADIAGRPLAHKVFELILCDGNDFFVVNNYRRLLGPASFGRTPNARDPPEPTRLRSTGRGHQEK